MKTKLNPLRFFLLLASLFLSLGINAQQPEEEAEFTAHEQLEISLLTCEPFHQIYSLYGHTGLRIRNLANGDDFVANWGIFDMSKSFFALRFMFGLTDYRMEIESFRDFCERYSYYGAGVKEQVLNLSQEEAREVLSAVAWNYLPENRVYRYNFFFDNCTTRARDVVFSCISGELRTEEPEQLPSFRDEIRRWNAAHPWMAWGNDMLLGAGADAEMTAEEREFIPDNLREDFDRTKIVDDAGERPLVKETRYPVALCYEAGSRSFLSSPTLVALLLAVVCALVCWLERRKGRRFWQADLALLLLSGVPGTLLMLMIFSQHPTVSFNLQILIFNPLALLLLWPITKKLRRGGRSGLLKLLSTCAMAGFVVGAIGFQHYAEGSLIMAFLFGAMFIRPNAITNEKKQ